MNVPLFVRLLCRKHPLAPKVSSCCAPLQDSAAVMIGENVATIVVRCVCSQAGCNPLTRLPGQPSSARQRRAPSLHFAQSRVHTHPLGACCVSAVRPRARQRRTYLELSCSPARRLQTLTVAVANLHRALSATRATFVYNRVRALSRLQQVEAAHQRQTADPGTQPPTAAPAAHDPGPERTQSPRLARQQRQLLSSHAAREVLVLLQQRVPRPRHCVCAQ